MATYKDVLILVDKVTKPLQKVSEQMKKTSENGDKLRDKIGKLNQRMEKMRPALNKVWGGVMRLTRAFIGLVGSSGVLTMGIAKVTEYADHIDKMSQKIGMTTDSYQKWNYIMSINGGNVDSLSMGFKTLTTQIAGVQKGSKESIDSFRKLGVQVKDSNGKFRSSEAIFDDVVKSLQDMDDKTERDIIANKLFGRSASELRPLLNQSSKEIERLTKNFEKYGMKLSKKEIKNAVEFKDTWTTFTMFLQSQTNKALTNLLPKLQGILEKIMAHKEAIKKIISAIGELTEKVFKVIEFLSKHKGLLSFILGVIVALGVFTLWANISAGITTITTAMAIFGTTSNIALAGIPALLGLISSAIAIVAMNWGHNLENMGKAIDWLTDKVDSLLDKLGILAYFIPGIGAGKLSRDIAEHFGRNNKDGGFTSHLRQQQINNNTSNITTNNYYSGSQSIGAMNTSIGAYVPSR